MEKSLEIFEGVIKSKFTLVMYRYHLEMFRKFTKIKNYDTLASLDTDTIQAFLENYIMYLKRRKLKPISVKNYIKAPELFFDMNKKVYFKVVLQKMIPEMQKAGNDMPYTTEDIQRMILGATPKRTRALVYFFASTGARPNVLADPILRLRHLHLMPEGCKAVLLYEGSKDEYWAFLTPETVKAIDEYIDERKREGEIITDESPVFANYSNRGKCRHLPTVYSRQIILRLVEKVEIEREKVGERFDKAVIYGFRKRFNTILKINNNINSNIAEKLMAHKNGLDGVYLKPTREQCFAEFVKALPELTIFPTIKKVERKEEVQVEAPIPKPKEYPIYG